MINSINLINFKCYEEQSFDLKNLTVFCGNNSTGKSTAIQALGILLQSQFKERATLNGELVNVGYHNDIRCSFNSCDNLSINISTDNATLSWGLKPEDIDSSDEKGVLKRIHSSNTNVATISPINFQFLEAERYGPRDNSPLSQTPLHKYWLGAKGEFTIEVLERITNKDTLVLDENDPRKHEATKSNRLLSNINAWMGEISPGFKIDAERNERANVGSASIASNNDTARKPINVGFGLSYVLSIVTALLITPRKGLVIIENPEAHLHPRGQSYIGRLVALASIAGVQIVVETHSEHIINGIRIIARLNKEYTKDSFKIYYISKRKDNTTNVDLLPVGNKGEIPKWPDGFFDQQSIDVKTLIQG